MMTWEARATLANGKDITKYYPCVRATDDEQYEVESDFVWLLDKQYGADNVAWFSVSFVEEV